MKPSQHVPELLARALAAIDRAAMTVPQTPDGRERLIAELGLARRNVRAAMRELDEESNGLGSVRSYIESSAGFIDELDSSLQVWFIIVPLPIMRRADMGSSLHDATRRILDTVLETINDGHIDDPWMHPGDFDWVQRADFVELSLVRGRRSLQSLVFNADGAVAVRDAGQARGTYPLARYEAMLEATAQCAERLFERFNMRTSGSAVQTYFVNAADLRIDIMRGIGRAWLRRSDQSLRFAVPDEPIAASADALRHPRSIVESAVTALTAASAIESDRDAAT